MLRIRALAVISCSYVLFAGIGAYGDSITIHVPADASCDLSGVIGVRHEFAEGAASVWLSAGGDVPSGTPAQFVADLDARDQALRRGTVWLPITIKAEQRGRTLHVTLTPVAARPHPAVELKELPGQATDFVDGQRLVFRYNHGPKDLEGKDDPNAVVGFIHPIHGLDGEVLTQNSPKDHLHHRGLFWAWPRLKQGEKMLGNWWERRDMRYRLGRIVRREAGPVLGTLTAEGFWDYQTKDMARPERVVREVTTLRLFGGAFTASSDYEMFDVDIDLYGLVDGLTMAGTKELGKGYGGFTLRWPAPKGVRVTADDKQFTKDGVLTRARWADASGAFPGATKDGRSGVAILTSPTHPGSPPPWLLRLYGVLNVSYPGLEFIPLPKDKPLHLSYRVIIHRGDAKPAHIDELYRIYATDWTAGASPATTQGAQ